MDSRFTRTFGAELLAFEDGSLTEDEKVDSGGLGDIALLRLLERPQGTSLLGWTTYSDAIAAGSNVIGIHHAEAKKKQISFEEIESTLSHMLYVAWGNGLTLEGASGSPLLNEDGRILGVLSGGRDDHEGCFDQGSPTLYSTLRSFYPKIRSYLTGEWLSSGRNGTSVSVGGPLTLGVPSQFRLSPADAGSLLNGERSYYVDVPSDATALTVTLVSDDPAIDIDLYVRYQADPTVSQYGWKAVGLSGNEEIEIGLGSIPALRAGRYYISLLFYSSQGVAASGTLTARLAMRVTGPARIEFERIPAGEFAMSSTSSEAYSRERPVTQVRISRAFEISRHEVTQGQWQAVMGSNPSSDTSCGADCPVETVSWNDVQEFIARLNAEGDGYEYSLPTEAEWEYSARAGTTGDRYGMLDSIAWHNMNSGARIHPVGLKAANEFGLHGMLGNVHELVEDWYGIYPGGYVTNPTWPFSSSHRVIRGGSYHDSASANRSPYRHWVELTARYANVGFRVRRVLKSVATPSLGGRLELGVPKEFTIPASEAGNLLNGSRSFFVHVPSSASRLRITVASDTPEIDVDLFVSYQADNGRSRYDWSSQGTSGNESLVLGQSQPLQPGRYYISLLLFDDLGVPATGSVTAAVTW